MELISNKGETNMQDKSIKDVRDLLVSAIMDGKLEDIEKKLEFLDMMLAQLEERVSRLERTE